MSGDGPPGRSDMNGSCNRCRKYGVVFPVADRAYCESCAQLCINDRPDYRKADRRNPVHEPRGYGRRFRDPVTK